MNDDKNTITLMTGVRQHHVHVRGFHGDGGENEGVLSINAVLDGGPYYPECGLIIVGSPPQSPLIEGYIPDLGGWCAGPDAVERLIIELQEAVRLVRAARSKP